MQNTIANWIKHREEIGGIFFSLEEVCLAFPQLSRQVVENGLYRLRERKIVYTPYRGFYVLLPASYRLRGAVPPMFYMEELMRRLGRRHYFNLLSAGVLWGAAHQRPTVDFVAVEGAKPFVSRKGRCDVEWVVRPNVPGSFIVRKSGEGGDILYSNAELTAVELVQYEHRVGGLSAVATVLRELLENTDFTRASEGVFTVCKDTAIQRLGFMVDRILHIEDQAEIIYGEWRRRCPTPHYTRLSSKATEVSGARDEKWRIIANATVEEDEQ